MNNRKDKTIAIILCIFLGCFGAQRFYLGDTTMGLVWLLGYWFVIVPVGYLFCFTIILFPVGMLLLLAPLVDLVPIMRMSDQEWADKYNNGELQASPRSNTADTADELEKLHELKSKGVLTEKEFQDKKEQLLK
tara:strand:+ start:781 stop:1182 length:402 start_codon:yes stop_codon:yes gene_type:complete